jgi:hypothetical protein
MNYREVELLRAESIATAGTRTLDLGTDQPVSRLDIVWKKTNSARVAAGHPHLIISRIDVVDGSDVLFSLDGGMAQAMAFFTQNRQSGGYLNYETGQMSAQVASIYFGRYMWDELYALDPKKHNNIQIKVAHNLASGGSVGTVADLSVYAHVFNDKVPAPKGFVQSLEIYSYLAVANAWVYIDMPQDYPIRGLMFGAPQCTEGPSGNLAQFKVSENGGQNILAEALMNRYNLIQSANLEPWSEHVTMVPAAVNTYAPVYVTPHWERRFTANVEGAGVAIGVRSDQGCLTQVQTAAGTPLVEGFVHGFCPFGQIWIPFAGQTEDSGWETVGKGNSRIDIQGSAGPDLTHPVKVAISQFRKY